MCYNITYIMNKVDNTEKSQDLIQRNTGEIQCHLQI
jgi:hypothetical protein